MARKMLIWLAVLGLLAGAAQAATLLCVNAPGVVALTDNRGVEIIENGRFESIFTVREGQLYAAGKRGDYRLFDGTGKQLGDVSFSMIDDTGNMLVYRTGHLFGVMNDAGEVLMEPGWTQLTPDGQGGWMALKSDPLDEQPDEIMHIDGTGAVKQTGVYCSGGLSPVSGDRMPYLDSEGRYGVMNADGAILVTPAWQYVSRYSNGLASVAGPEGMGMIDGNGRVIIAPSYARIVRSAAMIAAWDSSGVEIYGPRGGRRRVRLPGRARDVAVVGDNLVVNYGSRTCLYDRHGRLLMQSNGAVNYAAGTRGQLIASNGAWGERCQWLVNPDGSKASGMFQQLLSLCAERYAFMEMKGEVYDSEVLARSQTAWNYGECRYGLMDARGRILTTAKYREISALSAERLLLVGDDRVQIADRNGVVMKTWIKPEGSESSAEANE